MCAARTARQRRVWPFSKHGCSHGCRAARGYEQALRKKPPRAGKLLTSTSKTLLRTDEDGAPPMPQRTPNKLPLGKLEPFTRSIIGTPAYMAPEMLLEQPYNYRGRDDARGHGTDRPARARGPAPDNRQDRAIAATSASSPRRARIVLLYVCVRPYTKTYEARVALMVDAVVSSLRRCAGLR